MIELVIPEDLNLRIVVRRDISPERRAQALAGFRALAEELAKDAPLLPLVDAAASWPPKPPAGHANWLDYAVSTLDTRGPFLEQARTPDGVEFSREDMRRVAQDELSALRALAGVPDTMPPEDAEWDG